MSIKSLKLQKKLKKTHIFLIGLIFVGLLLHPAVQEYHKHLISSPKGDDNPNTEDAQGSEGNWEAFSSFFSGLMVLLTEIYLPQVFPDSRPRLSFYQHSAVLRC
jgi:hypothetical protein